MSVSTPSIRLSARKRKSLRGRTDRRGLVADTKSILLRLLFSANQKGINTDERGTIQNDKVSYTIDIYTVVVGAEICQRSGGWGGGGACKTFYAGPIVSGKAHSSMIVTGICS